MVIWYDPYLSIQGGHDNSTVLFLTSGGKDRIQVASVTGPAVLGTGYTTKQVIEKMRDQCQHIIDGLPQTVPVKKYPEDIISGIRHALRQVKDSILQKSA